MVNKFKQIILIGLVAMLPSVGAHNSAVDLKSLSLKNAKQPYENIITGGQPSLADLRVLKSIGVVNIINLRTDGEFDDYDEAAEVKKLGFNYHVMPVSGRTGIILDNAKKLDELLKSADGLTLVHCASSNRVGALFAIRAASLYGKDTKQALSEGQKAGLKSLYGKTEKLLNSLNP